MKTIHLSDETHRLLKIIGAMTDQKLEALLDKIVRDYINDNIDANLIEIVQNLDHSETV
jgi:hypothetical protein